VKVEIETLKKIKRHIPLVICINNNSKYNLKQGNE
jgi:hypothetical protein